MIPAPLKVAFWICWIALFLAYTMSPLYLGPVDPPIGP